MNANKKLVALGTAALLALAAGSAGAESTYGYNSAGTASVSTNARVNLSVTVPKMILLKIGTDNSAVANLAWTTSMSVTSSPTAPTNGSSLVADWNGTTAPALSVGTNPSAVPVSAWTNGSSGTLAYTATQFAGTGPKLADISVNAGSGLGHPGGNAALNTASSSTVSLTPLTVHSGSWSYALSNTNAATWQAGSYTTQVVYTAQAL